MHKLTIAIPTYNRNEKVKRIIGILLPQLTSCVKIKIFDNCSTESVLSTLKEYSHVESLEIIRNKVNVGMSGNFIKCFESCDTEWLWVLGDDDYPYDNAIQVIFEQLQKWPNSSFINFNSFMAPVRRSSISFNGPEELIKNLDAFGNLLCISLGLFNVDKLSKGLRFAYQFSYSIAPQLAFLLTGLHNGESVLSDAELINFSAHDTAPDQLWSWVSLSSAIGLLAELPLNLDEQTFKIFTGHLLTHIQQPQQLYNIIIENKYYTPKEKLRIFKMIYDRSTFGALVCARTPNFCKFYLKLWWHTLRYKQIDVVDLSSHYKRIERI